MLKLDADQTDALGETATAKFKRASIALLRKAEPDLCEGRDDAVLGSYVDKVFGFSADHRIARESNVQRLMLLNARHRFIDDTDAYLSYILGREGFSEDARMAAFRRNLNNTERRIRITLDTDLSQIG